ncbi:MAG: glycosyltransferase family 4 protein [Acidimicrobiales bacterium]
MTPTSTHERRLLSIQPVRDGGGSEHALIRMLGQLRGDGWECHVALPGPARLEADYATAGAVLHVVGMPRLTTSGSPARWVIFALAWPVVVLRLWWLARRVGADVVHTNSLHSWYGWAAAALARRPHVWHARELVEQSRLALRVERFLTRHFADQVVAASRAVAAQLDAPRVIVVTDEVDETRFSPRKAGCFRSRVGVGDDVPLVGSAARIDTWKGFDVLLDALPAMQRARPELQLIIAGPPVGGKEDYAAVLAARAGASRGAHWLGHREDMADLFADLDVFVQVSTNPEPFGLVLVEALASGTPVVAGAEGGPVEILAGAGSSAGRLVPPGDPAALAAAVLELLPTTSSTAIRRARQPLRQAAPTRFSEIFDAVLQERAPTSSQPSRSKSSGGEPRPQKRSRGAP